MYFTIFGKEDLMASKNHAVFEKSVYGQTLKLTTFYKNI